MITANPLKQKVWKSINFKIIPKWFTQNDIKNIVWLYGDWNNLNWTSLKSEHTYYKSDKYPVNSIITLNNWEKIYTSMTEAIVWINICNNLKLARQVFKCDMDHDGIPDMCDNDIDWDGIKNLIWIIKYENKNCSITNKNINNNTIKQEQNLAKNWWNIDNCPFTKNTEQIDTNNNWIWNTCDNDNYQDTDQDGIQDNNDNCPNIPWPKSNWWCPIINTITNNFSFILDNCNSCPCHFADYKTAFLPGMKVEAILVNPFDTNQIYKISQIKMVK